MWRGLIKSSAISKSSLTSRKTKGSHQISLSFPRNPLNLLNSDKTTMAISGIVPDWLEQMRPGMINHQRAYRLDFNKLKPNTNGKKCSTSWKATHKSWWSWCRLLLARIEPKKTLRPSSNCWAPKINNLTIITSKPEILKIRLALAPVLLRKMLYDLAMSLSKANHNKIC